MIGCFSYTDFSINAISFAISIIVTALVSLGLNSFNKVSINTKMESYYTNEIRISNVSTNGINVSNNNEDIFTNTNIEKNIADVWQIEIPKISLKADISEGTSKEVLDSFVGHFETTETMEGNIGLAAHNRGYKVNYFGRIKELAIGDEIYYTFGNVAKKYKVSLITIIKDTEWTYLEKTEDNRITLITCVEDEPEFRRCIQGVEFK